MRISPSMDRRHPIAESAHQASTLIGTLTTKSPHHTKWRTKMRERRIDEFEGQHPPSPSRLDIDCELTSIDAPHPQCAVSDGVSPHLQGNRSDGDEELDDAASISSTGSWLSTLTTAEWLEPGHPNNAVRSAIKCTSHDSTALVSAMNTHPVDESPTGKNNLENPGLKRFAKEHDDFGDFSAVSSTGSWSSTLTTAEWSQPGHSVHFRLDSTSTNVESKDSRSPVDRSPPDASAPAHMEPPSSPNDPESAAMDA